MEIRTLTIADYDAMIDLWHRAELEIKPNGRESRAFLSQEMQTNTDGFIGLVDNETLIGIVIVTYDGRRGWIHRLAVDPAYRRQGLGQRLIAEAEMRLKKRGAKLFAAFIEEENAASLGLFETMDYSFTRTLVFARKRESNDF